MTSEEKLLLKPYIFRTVQLPDWSTFFYSPPTVFPPQWSPNHPHLCLVNSLLACVYNYLSLSLWQLPICKPRSLWISLISRSLWGDQLTVEPESHDARLSPFPWFNESPVLDPPSLMDPGQQIHSPHPQPVSDSDVKGTARSVNPLPIFFFLPLILKLVILPVYICFHLWHLSTVEPMTFVFYLWPCLSWRPCHLLPLWLTLVFKMKCYVTIPLALYVQKKSY